MFEYLADYPVILVTGPQRSGTRVCAKMIAHDTGHRFVDEREIHTDSLYELMQVIRYQRTEPIVVQCPALMHEVGKIAARHSMFCEVALVVMERNTHDIEKSIRRVGWQWDWLEEERYEMQYRMNQSHLTKWNFFRKRMEPLLVRHDVPYSIVGYESLSEHPLWVPKEERKDWDAWQTE